MDPELQQQDQLPEPFTQADTIRLQQFNQGLSEAQKQVDEGTLTPQEGDQFKQGILKMRLPLLAKQEQSQKQAFQGQMKQQQQGSALAQGMQHADAVYRAKGFQERVSVYTDPLTGQSAHMYEHEPNRWKQIEFPEQAQAGEGQAQDYLPPEPSVINQHGGPDEPITKAPADYTGAGPESSSTSWDASAPEAPGGPPEDRGTPGVEGSTPGPGTPPGPLGPPVSNEDGTHTLDIWNGQSREQVRFDKQGRIVQRQQFDREGNPVGGQSQVGQPGQISPAEMGELRKRAEASVPPVPMPPGGLRDWHSAAAYRAQELERQKAVDHLHNHLVNLTQQQKNTSQAQGGRAAEAQRREQATETEHKRQEQERKDRVEATKVVKEHEKASSDKYHKEYDQARKNLTTKDAAPPTHDAIEAERAKIEKAHDEYVGRRTGKPVSPDAAAKPAAPRAEPAAPTPEVLAQPSKEAHTKKVAELHKAVQEIGVEGGTTILGMQIPNADTMKKNAQLGDVRRFLATVDARGSGMTIGERLHYEDLLRKTGDKNLMKHLWPGKWVDHAASGDGHSP